MKRLIVACEESQVVCTAFRNNGWEAYSCDIIECSGGHPEWHIQGDCLPLLNGDCEFTTMDGRRHRIDGEWDMIIAFPPCTHLAVSGARHFKLKREDGRQRDAIIFACMILTANCKRIALENPIGILSGDYVKNWFPEIAEQYGLPIKPSQIIQPWQFGHRARKATCVWLKNLPNLVPTHMVDAGEIWRGGFSVGANLNYAKDENGKALRWNDPRTAKVRSRTFIGVGEAMADQWGGLE